MIFKNKKNKKISIKDKKNITNTIKILVNNIKREKDFIKFKGKVYQNKYKNQVFKPS